MEYGGTYRIDTSRAQAWEAMHDPGVMRVCIPKCESMERINPELYHALFVVKVGPFDLSFKGAIKIEDSLAPERYTLVGEGGGMIGGMARGRATVSLTETGPASCELTYLARWEMDGLLARLGQKLVRGAAERYADDFFGRFAVCALAYPLVPEKPPEPLRGIRLDQPAG